MRKGTTFGGKKYENVQKQRHFMFVFIVIRISIIMTFRTSISIV